MSPGYMRDETGRRTIEAYFSNPGASLKKYLRRLKTKNYDCFPRHGM